jgi:hypothetical protein
MNYNSNFRFGKTTRFFVMLSAAKASECAKMLSKSCFLVKIQMLSLRSA